MPLFLEPDHKYPIVLDADAVGPVEDQPTFLALSQSMRGQAKVGEVLDMWTENPDLTTQELFDATVELLGTIIVGWKNMGDRQYSTDQLYNLTYSEARELLRKVMFNQHITPAEKKSSE